MNPDDLEQLLQRRASKPLPAAWRDGILSAAYEERAKLSASQPQHRRAWLTPARVRWGALAAVWTLAAFFHFSSRDSAGTSPSPIATSPVSGDAWRERQQLLAELLSPAPPAQHHQQKRPPEAEPLRRRSGCREAGAAVFNRV